MSLQTPQLNSVRVIVTLRRSHSWMMQAINVAMGRGKVACQLLRSSHRAHSFGSGWCHGPASGFTGPVPTPVFPSGIDRPRLCVPPSNRASVPLHPLWNNWYCDNWIRHGNLMAVTEAESRWELGLARLLWRQNCWIFVIWLWCAPEKYHKLYTQNIVKIPCDHFVSSNLFVSVSGIIYQVTCSHGGPEETGKESQLALVCSYLMCFVCSGFCPGHVENILNVLPCRSCGEFPIWLAFCLVVQKKALESINSRLALVMKSGKYVFGYKQTLKMLRLGKAKLVIIASNTPALRWDWEVNLQPLHEVWTFAE